MCSETWYRVEYKLDDGKLFEIERDEWIVPGNAFAKILLERGPDWVRDNVTVSYCEEDINAEEPNYEFTVVDINTLL